MVTVLMVAPGLTTAWSVQAPRDGAFREGRGSISGVVVAAEGGAPVARATVTLGSGTLAGFTVVSDAEGRFTFDRLPAGQFTLTASKPSFVTLPYGQTEPGRGSGLPIALKDGERLTGVQWALPRAASITGRVLDHAGRPMRGAVIALQQRRSVDGQIQLVACCGQARTDPNGLYRLAGLDPGEYAVSSLPPADYRFIPEVMSSFGSETRAVTADEVRWAQRELEIAAGRAGAAAGRLPEPPHGPTVSYGRTYFPGTFDPSRLSMIAIKAAEERRGVDISMPLQPTAFIQGRGVGPDGQPPVNATFAFSDGWSTATIGLAPDGTFSRRNLLPGRYTLTVRGRGSSLWGSEVVELNGADVPNLVITIGPGASVSGRVVFELGGAQPLDLAAVAASVVMRPSAGIPPARVAADGAFTIAGVDPGRYRLSVSLPAASRGPWTLKSIVSNGRDVADLPLEVAPRESISGVVVTLTTRVASLSGTLLTADGAPVPGYYVVVFPSEPSLWAPGSRRLPAPARSSTEGRFSFAALPPGSYCLAAVTGFDEGGRTDPAYLTALKASATTITLAEGEQKVQDVKFARR